MEKSLNVEESTSKRGLGKKGQHFGHILAWGHVFVLVFVGLVLGFISLWKPRCSKQPV